MFDTRPAPTPSAPELPVEPIPSATPIATPKPVERPVPAVAAPKKLRAPPPKKKTAPIEPPPAPRVAPRPFAEKLARVKAAPTSDLRFELADDVEAAANGTLDRDAAAGVKACLTQFRITGGVRHLEQCVEKFERARGSVMTR